MFTRTREPNEGLSKAMDKALLELSNHRVTSPEYSKIMDQLVKLRKMQEEEKPASVSPDTLALISANLIGILLILKYERVDIITSKALNMVPKLK